MLGTVSGVDGVTPDHAARHAKHGCAGRDIPGHDRIKPDRGAVADPHLADDLGAGPHRYAVADRRTVVVVRIADADLLIEPEIRADPLHRDHRRKTVLDETARAEFRNVEI